jgi:hypothetical protein
MTDRPDRTARHRADQLEINSRLLTVEELLVSGLSPARVERELSKKYGISTRQVRKYVTKIVKRWQEDSKEDAAYRREKLFRMAERLYAKAYAQDRLGPANAALQTLARLGGAFAKGEADRTQLTEVLGPPPTDDPTKALIYAQNVLVLTLKDIAEDPTIEPERRWRLLADLAAKVGMTHSRSVIQNEINVVKKSLGTPSGAAPSARGAQPLAGVSKPLTARNSKLLPPRH